MMKGSIIMMKGGIIMRLTKVSAVLIMSLIFTLLLFSLVYANGEGCAAGGNANTGGESAGGGDSGDHSNTALVVSTHTGWSDYSEESFFMGLSYNFNGGGEAVFMGAGLGKRGYGTELTLTIADVSKFSDLLFSIKHQLCSETSTRPAVALGVDAINEIPEQMERSIYLVGSKYFTRSKLPMVVSLGWGTGRFNDNVFGSVALIWRRNWSFIGEYDGRAVNVGVSLGTKIAQEKREALPVVLTLAVHNVFGSAGESVFGVGAGLRFH